MARGGLGKKPPLPWLAEHEYRLEETNLQNAAGEIDAVAWHEETLCFIEIKTRSSAEFGLAIEAVDRKKQNRIGRVASLYLVKFGANPPNCRFDVLGIDRVENEWVYTLVQDAFFIE